MEVCSCLTPASSPGWAPATSHAKVPAVLLRKYTVAALERTSRMQGAFAGLRGPLLVASTSNASAPPQLRAPRAVAGSVGAQSASSQQLEAGPAESTSGNGASVAAVEERPPSLSSPRCLAPPLECYYRAFAAARVDRVSRRPQPVADWPLMGRMRAT